MGTLFDELGESLSLVTHNYWKEVQFSFPEATGN